MSLFNAKLRIESALARRAAKWLARRPWQLRTTCALVTFTFDDFPVSAFEVGGDLLENAGTRGTYFVAHGLAHQVIATGPMFAFKQLGELVARGHELGCHTFEHLPAWSTPCRAYESSVERNAEAQRASQFGPPFHVHSYPISYPRPDSKKRMARRFRACRGGGQVANSGTVDLNYLSSFFLEQCGGKLDAIEQLLEANIRNPGWLIFSTHDVSNTPTRYGVTPGFLSSVVTAATRSGARLVTMSQALDILRVPSKGTS
ncbi:polysaccharide deacetylase family protein [Horticoccus sp. 23ND18S-11]|uniref:polysaccharide deacetylase family protein n=1 Tax=Horticoccus sp. 23ND18S-11 TaxID=3391832 RepID=UPI0039C8CE0C